MSMISDIAALERPGLPPRDARGLDARGLNTLGLPMPPAECRVVVAMSGGVDSSVTAAILKAEGYDVVGITLQLYDHGEAVRRKGACCAGQDIHDARRVADALEMPHYVLDYENRFREEVMEDFADTYLRGETPIPCVRCNERVKFRDLLSTAKDLGAACMATGHYIRRTVGPEGAEMRRAVDPERDQSYFLFSTTREQLDFLRFPLGDLHKPQVRDMAMSLGLVVAEKPDSQDICFVPTGRYTSVIERLRPGAFRGGEIVHLDGRVLGEHDGVINFTVGQRRGLGVALGEPLFVVGVDAAKRQVIVGPREALLTKEIAVGEVNWLGAGEPDGTRVLVKVRSTRPPKPAVLRVEGGDWRIVLDEPEEGVAPGQAAVFYADDGRSELGDRVLGGGWIAGATSLYQLAA